MKFNLEETVTGADLRPGAILLVFPRERLTEILNTLGEQCISVDAFVVDREKVTMAVYFPEDAGTPDGLSEQDLIVEQNYFRLTLRGHRLTEGKGLAALWESVLADENIPLRLSCSDCSGITQYLPDSAKNVVLELLNRTFGIQGV